MNPCFSSVASVRSTALIGSFATRTAIPRALPRSRSVHARQRRVGKHAIGNQPIERAAAAAGEVVANDPKIVDRYVRELRTAGAFADRPDIGRARLQSLVDADVAPVVEIDAGDIEADRGRYSECVLSATIMSLPSIVRSPEAVRTETATASPERPCTRSISAATRN